MKRALAVFLLSAAAPAWADSPALISTWKGHSDGIGAVAFSPDGKTALSGSADRTLRLWDVVAGKTLIVFEELRDGINTVAFTRDGKRAISDDHHYALRVWDVATGKTLRTLGGNLDAIRTITLSPDERTAAVVTFGGMLRLWDFESGRKNATLNVTETAQAIDAVFSPDGKSLLTGRWDRTLRLWDLTALKTVSIWKGHRNRILSVGFSPDGKRAVSGSEDNTVRIWDCATGRTLLVLRGHKGHVNTVAFSPDGKRVVSGSRDKTVRLWDAQSGKNLGVWRGHRGSVQAVVFSPDGAQILSASEDRTLKLWDATGKRPVRQKTGGLSHKRPLTLPPGPESRKARLGKWLFFDQRLSGDSSISCVYCHIPKFAFADDLPLSLGYPDTLYFRNTPTLINAAAQKHLYWDGRFPGDDLTTLIRDHLSEAHFMNADGRLIVEKLRQAPGYVEAFRKVFGEDPTYGGILEALAAYVSTLKSGPTPFDRFVAGEDSALSPSARRGFALFRGSAGCVQCHSGNNFSDGKFHDRKVPDNPDIRKTFLRHITLRRFLRMLGVKDYHKVGKDIGVYAVTKKKRDRGKFRTPQLREVARTAPYMHNGMMATLDEAVAHESRRLTASQRKDIVQFLKSLSSKPSQIDNPLLPQYALRPKRKGKAAKLPAPRKQELLPASKFPELGPLPEVSAPSDNPMTTEKAWLGRLLFYDQRISGNGETYCISCHEPAMGWGDGIAIPHGYEGTLHWRNSSTLLNAAYFSKFNWDGNKSSLEEQARSAITTNIVGNGDPVMIEERLAEVPEYVARFKEVFGVARPHFEGVLKAIATFLRTVPISKNVPFDKYVQGDSSAISPEAVKGLDLFKGKAGCIRCHNGPLVSDQGFHSTGVPRSPAFDAEPLQQITIRYQHVVRGVSEKVYRHADSDQGLFFTTRQERDIGKFRTPSLRELKYTSPYMHNGTLETLEEVVDFYNKGAGDAPNKSSLLKPLKLSSREKRELIAFLLTLSGDPIVIEHPLGLGEHYTTTGYHPPENRE